MLKTEENVIAYIDLLGATNRILNDSNDIELNLLLDAYDTADKIMQIGSFKNCH